jgi:CheY-like chemotaxis protein
MGQPIFIKVLGFTDVERHAINSIFRLSQERTSPYALWRADSGHAAQLVLMDGLSYEARLELAAREVEAEGGKPQVNVVWVGHQDETSPLPLGIWRHFERPLHWPDIVAAMDGLFNMQPALDFDLDAAADSGAEREGQPTQPGADEERVLVVYADLEKRYYLRSVLALSGWLLVDEAASAAQANELLQRGHYAFVMLSLDMPALTSWVLIEHLQHLPSPRPIMLASTKQRGWWVPFKAWRSNVNSTWREPMDSRQLHRKFSSLLPPDVPPEVSPGLPTAPQLLAR